MKMKRSQFKALVKQCLKEILEEQVNPRAVQESLAHRAMPPTYHSQLVNPADPHQLQMRQELVSQKRLLQNQLQRQGHQHQPQNGLGSVVALDELAGLSGAPDRSSNGAMSYNVPIQSSGYSSPHDYLGLARQQNSSLQQRYDPRLDAQLNQAPQNQDQRIQRASKPFRLDPELDMPYGGGDMRPPNVDIMKDIYADTMESTYVQQLAAGHTTAGSVDPNSGMGYAAPADNAAAIVGQHNPEELFEGSQNWAMLAFR